MSLYIISGLSGSGKSSCIKWMEKNSMLKHNSVVIDQDSYFYSRLGQKNKMPRIKLSNGIETMNYDSPNSIDNNKLESDVNQYLKNGKNVYMSAFMFRSTMYNLVPKLHIHLIIGKEMSLKRRMHSKGYSNPVALMKDKLMMDEVIFPEYLETLRLSKIDYYLDGTDIIEKNCEKISKIINGK